MKKYQISILKERETEPSNPGGSNLSKDMMLSLKWFKYDSFEDLSKVLQKRIVKQELRKLDKHSIRFDKEIKDEEQLRVTKQGDHSNPLWEKEIDMPSHLVDKSRSNKRVKING